MLIKIIRWVIFIPLILLVFYLIQLSFDWLVYKALALSTFWLIVIAVFFGSIILGLFASLVSLLSSTVFLVAPNKKAAGIIFSIAAILVGIIAFYIYLNLDFKIVAKIIVLSQVVWLWGMLAFLGFSLTEGDNS